MKSNHLTHCLVGIAAAVGLLVVFGVQAGTLVYLAAVLACPLMMVLMMRGMVGGHGQAGCIHPDHQHTSRDASTEPAERTR
jgi:hypothetical protein